MSLLVVLASLCFLMFVAYRGYNVIRFAPIAALGAVNTLLAVTGLTHRVSYKDIFAITPIKTTAVFVVIATFYLTGIV